jgi:hypothetical protein
MANRKLSVPVRRISFLVQGWDEAHKLFRIVLVQAPKVKGDTKAVRNFNWDPKLDSAELGPYGTDVDLEVPDHIGYSDLARLIVQGIKDFKKSKCPTVRKFETLASKLEGKWLHLSVS